MKILLFGATGMVGQGVLRECLLDPDVQQVLSVTRRPTGLRHDKLREVVHADLWHIETLERELAGVDACFFCLGVSSLGMSEHDYARVTYELTMAIAGILARASPQATFVYVSGTGTDSSERGRLMWARVKGRTENALLRAPFKAAFMFRPGIIQPLYGVRSKTGWYRAFYLLAAPLLSVLHRLSPALVVTTEEVGRAMLAVAKRGAPTRILENRDISRAAATS